MMALNLETMVGILKMTDPDLRDVIGRAGDLNQLHSWNLGRLLWEYLPGSHHLRI